MPLYSLMIATEPLPADVWDELGWEGRETVSDLRHLFFYAQRTPDDRIAIGGRGAPYRLGSPIDESYERNDSVRARLVAHDRGALPGGRVARRSRTTGAARSACRATGAARCTTTRPRASAGRAATPGMASSRATCSAARWPISCCGARRDLVSLPWVGHTSPRWEPEPLRFLASRAIVSTLGSADRAEDRRDRPAWRTRLVRPFMQARS